MTGQAGQDQTLQSLRCKLPPWQPMPGQLRRHSLLETCCSTATGFGLSFAATFVVFPAFGLVSTSANFWITVIFTVISLVRQYCWRRVFNWLQHRRA